VSLRSWPARLAIEIAIIVAIGVGLAQTDIGLALFIVLMAIVWIAVAGLERVVLQPGRRSEPLSDEALPVHEAGVERDVPAGTIEAEPEPAGAPARREGVRRLEETEKESELEQPEAWEEEPILGTEPVQEAPVAEVWEPEPAREPEPELVPVVVVEEVTTVAVLESEPEPVVVVDELTTVAVAEPEAEPDRPPVQLAAAPPPEPEPAPARSTVVELPTRGAREWNLWDLERRARERAGQDPFRAEEWAALFVYLREYASPDGMLPPEFDDLIRDSFGDLLLAGPA
jgi:hypothetical protein